MNTSLVTDELMKDAVEAVLQRRKASVTMLQRRFHIGYTRARRLIVQMEKMGIVGPHNGYEARNVLMTVENVKRRYADMWIQRNRSKNDE